MANHKLENQDSNPIFNEWESLLSRFIDGKDERDIEFFVSSFEVYTEHHQMNETLTTALKIFSDSSQNNLDNLICYIMLSVLGDDFNLYNEKISQSIMSFFHNHVDPFMVKDISHLNKIIEYIDNFNMSTTYDSISLREKLSTIPYSIEGRQSRAISNKILLLSKIIDLSNISPVKPIPKQIKRSEQNSFINKGEVWEISFNGKSTNLPSTRGLKYIHELLLKEGEEIACFELEKSLAIGDIDQNTRNNILASINPDRYDKDEKKTIDTSNVDLPFFDDKYEAELKDRIKKLETQRKEYMMDFLDANERKDDKDIKKYENKVAEVEDEIKTIEKHLRLGKNKSGKTRNLSDENDKCRQRVTKAIGVAIKNIKKKLPELKTHFKNPQLKTGYICSYKPTEPVEWILFDD